MSLHKFALEFDAAKFTRGHNEERRRIDEWLKANTPRFEAAMKEDGCAEMYLDGVIGDDFGGVSAPTFQRQLDSLKDAKEITVHVNSPGGFIDDGMAMYNALSRHSAKIITNVVGQAASSASFIVQAGDERRMGESTTMFLHRALGLTYGNDEDHEKMAAYLKQNTEAIANVYAKRSGRRADSFLKMMSEDTQLTAAQALDAKLIDAIVPLKKPTKTQDAINGFRIDSVFAIENATPDTLDAVRNRILGANGQLKELFRVHAGDSEATEELKTIRDDLGRRFDAMLNQWSKERSAVNAKSIIDRKLRMMAMEEV
jgi:ATP-dependent Clp endopeptidase proteolytic subunit ClpP